MQLTKKLTLASQSKIRAAVLEGAGLDFEVQVSGVDEDALKAAHHGAADALALALAAAKAQAVAAEGLLIGADQILECDGKLYDKPRDMDEARHNLSLFRGKTHYLVGGVVLVEGGETVWAHGGRVALTMRDFSDAFLDAYLAAAGERVLSSVGCYQLEGLGAHLFSAIDGDYFSILGLPLLPLLDGLRTHGGLIA
ncbi:MAG: Maf family protein [PS1 clade bacterium]|uniref:Nucleoside triphosphate pyrophosphatase n=1 Tax=PS1 clade bacterium TaxID=2175152 RepID=A0A937L730_9PROT|nr:Maf family protein [PS1 clade bacterium]